MFRSTKCTDRKVALKICFGWEQAGAQARRKELTAAQARKVIAEMVAISTGETMSFHTARGWFNDWLANKTGAVSERTLFRYRQVVRDFLTHWGPRAEASIASVSPATSLPFEIILREEGRSVATCNAIRSMLSVPFEWAHKLGFVPINPVPAVEPLKDRSAKSGREPFTAQESVRLVESAQGDWRGAVLLGATTGLRWATWQTFAGRALIWKPGFCASRQKRPAGWLSCQRTLILELAVRKTAWDRQGSCFPATSQEALLPGVEACLSVPRYR